MSVVRHPISLKDGSLITAPSGKQFAVVETSGHQYKVTLVRLLEHKQYSVEMPYMPIIREILSLSTNATVISGTQ